MLEKSTLLGLIFCEEMKYLKNKNIYVIVFLIFVLLSISVFADDNADTGEGDTTKQKNINERGFYRSSEYMYKVSVFVGLSDEADMYSDINSLKMIGNNPIYVKPSTFSLSNNTIGSRGNKIDYSNGERLSNIILNQNVITDNPPPIPITNGGNINSVKSYFGDTETLNFLIDAFADQKGILKEGLVSNINFTIDGETGRVSPDEILPIKLDGEYQNKVAWLIVYEPVIISYLKPDASGNRMVLAFTATEYAIAQKEGYFNFFWGDGQYIAGMTHSDLPNAIFLEESWVGVPSVGALPDGVHWSDDRIISGGGIGMRMLEANGIRVIENNTTYDYTYRVNTDVITSVRVQATSGDISPDLRHLTTDTRSSSYYNPPDGKAYVTFSANGQSVTEEIIIPDGNSEYVWLKWHTPSVPCDVEVMVSITGNVSAKFESGGRSTSFTVRVEDLSENEPPDPKAHDKLNNFIVSDVPVEADKETATWGIYTGAVWSSDYVWNNHWVWESDWRKKYYKTYHFPGCQDIDDDGVNDYCPGHRKSKWVDYGSWVDRGWWLDYGEWIYTYETYFASMNVNLNIFPDEHNPTIKESFGEYTMGSGYGIDVEVIAGITTNAPSSHYEVAQNVITYFPEFTYQTYWRLLEKTGLTRFEFKENRYSTFNSRTHFTPLAYPDGKYEVYVNVIDCYTPDGMLRINLSDDLTIDGTVFDDWYVAPVGN
jgi:hypothetical protein